VTKKEYMRAFDAGVRQSLRLVRANQQRVEFARDELKGTPHVESASTVIRWLKKTGDEVSALLRGKPK